MEQSIFDRPLYRNYLFLLFGFIIICCLMNGNLSIYMYSSIALMAVGIILRFGVSTKVNIKLNKFQLWMLLLWGYILLNGFFISKQYFGWKTIFVFMLPAVAVLLFFSPFKNKRLLFDIFCKCCELGAVLLILYITVFEFSSVLAGGLRIGSSASGNVNTVAMNLCVFSLVIYYEIIFELKKKLWPLFAICVLFILLTGSKKGLIGLALVIILLSVFKYRYKAYKYILPALLIGVALYFVLNNTYLYSILGRRINDFNNSIKSNQINGSTGERIGMIKIGWQMFLNSPIIGNGYGYFAYYSGYQTYSHNNYIEMLVSFGILGTALYYSIFLDLLISAFKRFKENNHAVLFLCLILLHISFDFASVNFYNNPMMYIVLFFASKELLSRD